MSLGPYLSKRPRLCGSPSSAYEEIKVGADMHTGSSGKLRLTFKIDTVEIRHTLRGCDAQTILCAGTKSGR